MSRGRLLAALFLVGVSAALVHALAHPPVHRPATLSLEQAVLELQGWQMEVRTLSDRQYELLESREILFRDYRQQDETVQVCIAMAGGNRKVAHPPQICYRGQGWSVSGTRDLEVELAGTPRPIQEIRITKSGRQQLVWSWYRVGERETASYLRQQWWGLRADLARTEQLSALLRFSTPLSRDEQLDPAPARARLEQFLEQCLPRLNRIFEERDS